MGRHSAAVTTSNRRPLVITIVGVAVLSLGGFVVARAVGPGGGDGNFATGQDCDQPVDVSLSTAPELKPQLEAAAKSLAGRDDSHQPCATFKISQAAPSVVADQLASGSSNRPDLWIPDSSLWVARADDGNSLPTIAVPSIASTPMVLVGPGSSFANTASWLSAFQSTRPYLLDPQRTTTGLAALIAVQAERVKTNPPEAQVDAMLIPLAQFHGSLAKPYTDLDGLFSKAAPDKSNILVPAPEQAFVMYQEKHPEIPLQAKVPGTGTLVFDYPIVVTAKDDSEKINQAAQMLAAEMSSDAVAKARDEAGFRNPSMDPLGGGRGVGAVNMLATPQPEIADRALDKWETYALSAHSLVVIDTSGSMAEKVGNRTRMQLAIAAAEKGLGLFRDTAQLGLWGFSTETPSRSTDWHSQVPIRRLGTKVGGVKHRDVMLQTLHSFEAKMGGGTGLYETAVGAYRTVLDGFDPRSINSVILFTDGQNDDSDSPSLTDTLATLERLKDPAQPVRIIAIGMGPDADEAELKKLAQATGGRHYIARDPDAIQEVFIDAIKAR